MTRSLQAAIGGRTASTKCVSYSGPGFRHQGSKAVTLIPETSY